MKWRSISVKTRTILKKAKKGWIKKLITRVGYVKEVKEEPVLEKKETSKTSKYIKEGLLSAGAVLGASTLMSNEVYAATEKELNTEDTTLTHDQITIKDENYSETSEVQSSTLSESDSQSTTESESKSTSESTSESQSTSTSESEHVANSQTENNVINENKVSRKTKSSFKNLNKIVNDTKTSSVENTLSKAAQKETSLDKIKEEVSSYSIYTDTIDVAGHMQSDLAANNVNCISKAEIGSDTIYDETDKQTYIGHISKRAYTENIMPGSATNKIIFSNEKYIINGKEQDKFVFTDKNGHYITSYTDETGKHDAPSGYVYIFKMVIVTYLLYRLMLIKMVLL